MPQWYWSVRQLSTCWGRCLAWLCANFRIRHLQRESVYSSYHALKATLPMHYYDMPGDSFPTKHTDVYLAPSLGFRSFCTHTSNFQTCALFPDIPFRPCSVSIKEWKLINIVFICYFAPSLAYFETKIYLQSKGDVTWWHFEHMTFWTYDVLKYDLT